MYGRLNQRDTVDPQVQIKSRNHSSWTRGRKIQLAIADNSGLGAFIVHTNHGDNIITGEGIFWAKSLHRSDVTILQQDGPDILALHYRRRSRR